MVSPSNTTLSRIQTKVRQLTGLPSEAQLSTSAIQEYINDFYSLDFPHELKVHELRNTYDFYTSPGVNRYVLSSADLNGNLYLNAPFYVDGYPGQWYKTRDSFYAVWPRRLTIAIGTAGNGSVGPYAFTVSGAPLLPNEFFVSATNNNGVVEVLAGDNSGNLLNSSGVVKGAIDYTSGAVTAATFATLIPTTENISASYVLVNRSRPIDGLYFRDYIELRPVPDGVYKVEVETYQPPTQFLATGDSPTLSQWWEYLAYGAAKKVLQDRGDDEGVGSIMPEMLHQESLIYTRTALDLGDQRAATIYTGSMQAPNIYPGYYR